MLKFERKKWRWDPEKYISTSRFNLLNSLRPRQNGRRFADDTFKRIFLNENIRISTKSSLKFVPKGLINNIPALVLIMAWRRPGDKPLSEPMLVRSLTHICVTRPQWVKPTDAVGHPKSLSALVKLMARCLLGDKPLPDSMLTYWQLNPCEQTTKKFKWKQNIFYQKSAF